MTEEAQPTASPAAPPPGPDAGAPIPGASQPASIARALDPAPSGWPTGLPPMFVRDPDTDEVIATLDAEMARLEQSVTRSGWTSWAGTAALGGIAWVFITLLSTDPAFPWHNFFVITTLLSLVQDFLYGVDYALRPRRGLGLLVGGQTRIMFSKETLPFARKQYCFYFVRAFLLATASYLFLPAIFGWTWWFPFIIYTLVCVAMSISVIISVIDLPMPKHEKFNIGELLSQGLLCYLAVTALATLADSWQDGDFTALKAALLVIAATHVLRGLAEPQFELPALDKLRELRRNLGFGQIIPLQAVAQAEAALFGQPSIIVIAPEILASSQAWERLHLLSQKVTESVVTLGAHLQSMRIRPDLTIEDIRIAEGLFRDSLTSQKAIGPGSEDYAAARETLTEKLAHYKENTKNDASIPLVDEMIKGQGRKFIFVGAKVLADLKVFVAHTRDLEQIAAQHNLPIMPEMAAGANALEAHISRQIDALKQTATDLANLKKGPA